MLLHRSPLLARLTLLSFLAAAGCGGSATHGTGGTTGSGGASSTTTGTTTGSSSTGTTTTTSSSSSGNPTCLSTSTTMLPGVHIEIDASQCTFSLSDPVVQVSFPYKVVVDKDTDGVTPRAQDGTMCGKPGPSGLIPFEKVDGNGQMYCLCQLGKCAPPNNPLVTLKQGSYPATFTWDKHNWFGPSDTNQPEGALFPVGDYTVTVSAIGTQLVAGNEVGFVVEATLPIHLVP